MTLSESVKREAASIEYLVSRGNNVPPEVLEHRKICLAALEEKASRESPEPFSAEELEKMDGEKIRIHYIGACEGFYQDVTAPYYGQKQQYISCIGGLLCGIALPLQYYGKGWIAYRPDAPEVAP